MKPSLVSRGRKKAFGYEREWIVLEFDPRRRGEGDEEKGTGLSIKLFTNV